MTEDWASEPFVIVIYRDPADKAGPHFENMPELGVASSGYTGPATWNFEKLKPWKTCR